jgi:hypothetical protein
LDHIAAAESMKITLLAISVEIELMIHERTIVLHRVQAEKRRISKGWFRNGTIKKSYFIFGNESHLHKSTPSAKIVAGQNLRDEHSAEIVVIVKKEQTRSILIGEWRRNSRRIVHC